MRKVFNVLAVVFVIISIVFVVLPMGTLGLLPVGIALVFSILAFVISDGAQKKFPKILLIVSGLLLVLVLVKAYAIPDEVAQDEQFEQQKVESKKEDLKELEELESDLE